MWLGWKDYITKIFNSCKICQELQISKLEGPPRQDKLKLTDLEPLAVLHINQFQYAQKTTCLFTTKFQPIHRYALYNVQTQAKS